MPSENAGKYTCIHVSAFGRSSELKPQELPRSANEDLGSPGGELATLYEGHEEEEDFHTLSNSLTPLTHRGDNKNSHTI